MSKDDSYKSKDVLIKRFGKTAPDNVTSIEERSRHEQQLQRFLKEREPNSAGSAETGRTVGQLLHAAEVCTAARKRLDTVSRVKKKDRREWNK